MFEIKNKLGLLGFLGLLGLLGFFTGNSSFYGFFSFFCFFIFSSVLPDELFKNNVKKAAKNAFFTSVLVFPVVALWSIVTSYSIENGLALGFGLNFGLQAFVFGISLAFYEKTG